MLMTEYIREMLKSGYTGCDIDKNIIDKEDIDKISITMVEKILQNGENNGADINAVLCLFDTIFKKVSKKRSEFGLHSLCDTINKWLINMKILSSGVNGEAYSTKFLSDKINVVIKIPKSNRYDDYEDMIREYFMGISAINNLRYVVPNFSCVLGAFMCNRPDSKGMICNKYDKDEAPMVLYEQINGETLHKMIYKNSLDFPSILTIYVQLLVALEIAQQNINFTHYDLHSHNVMIKKVKDYNYTVPVNNIIVDFINIDNLPIIIDYGMSTVYTENMNFGTKDYITYNIFNYMIQGYDMYKILMYITNSISNPNTLRNLRGLFRFYKDDEDPYYIRDDDKQQLELANREYCSRIAKSKAATKTPMMMLEWILDNYSSILKPYVRIKSRDIYRNITYSIVQKEYNMMLNSSTNNLNISVLNEYMENMDSYILSLYSMNILEIYNEQLESEQIKDRIDSIKIYIDMNKKELILADNKKLDDVFNITAPNEKIFKNVIEKVFDVSIVSNKDEKENVINLLINYHYSTDLTPYLKLYYIITELDIIDIYKDWVIEFEESNVYNFYLKYYTIHMAALRWCYTLNESKK